MLELGNFRDLWLHLDIWQPKIKLRLYHIGNWKHRKYWGTLDWNLHLWSAISDPQDQHIGSKTLLGDYCLLGSFVYCHSIIHYVVAPHTCSIVFSPQIFTVWVYNSLVFLGVRRYHIIVFSGEMACISDCDNMDLCFESKCQYRILQFLVKLCPLGSG